MTGPKAKLMVVSLRHCRTELNACVNAMFTDHSQELTRGAVRLIVSEGSMRLIRSMRAAARIDLS